MGFALSTRTVAKLAGTTPQKIYTTLSRAGHWRGIAPQKICNGRLLWPAAWVCDELGIAASDAPQVEKLFVDFLLRQGLPVCPETMRTGRALLSHETKGRDPSFTVGESALIAEIVNAWATRACDALPKLTEDERELVIRARNRIAGITAEVRDEQP